ncbi:flavin reductase family protein [Micromonospora purpureochromogenes]|uniref:Flavin reductase ActVB n=1 Tax=Micromonospora purpureochromogenes TaxID=47872 RepID=A0ABX2RW98_9ACTN|nr:flavin reductase family protein [Micromonospora purpureochromogenes]NYF59549.1 flavin reductase ActVB [Micromonospora purpureochromogenes]
MRSTDSTISDNGVRPVDPAAYREAMARFPSGVAIVTTHDEDGTPYGFTASSFCSVSLDPPLVLVCLARSANSFPVFQRSRHFAVSFLRSHHVDLAKRFASKSPDKFGAGGFVRTDGGATVLREALAAVECVIDSRHVAGDHVILVGGVQRVVLPDDGSPVVYFDRGFRALCGGDCPHPAQPGAGHPADGASRP